MSPENHYQAAADAIRSGDTETLKTCLKAHPELANKIVDSNPPTLLHTVLDISGHGTPTSEAVKVEAIKALLAAGADPDLRREGGETPLQWAASGENRLNIIETLLDGGADINATGAVLGNGTALMNAVGFNSLSAAELLVQRGAACSVILAAGMGRLDLVESFFDEAGNLKPGAGDLPGMTTPPTTQGILDKAFVHGCRSGNTQVTDFLLKKGAHINALALMELEATGLHRAIERAHLKMVQWLVEQGADINIVDSRHNLPPLGWAVTNGNEEIVHYLINQKPEDLNAPLHAAARRGKTHLAKRLLNHGADPNTKNKHNKTALKIAIDYKHGETAEMIRTHGGEE